MARKELTRSKAQEYHRASKKRKGQILDIVCEDTGWSRDNARRQLGRALVKSKGKQAAMPARRRPLKYSARARQVLTNAWLLSGTTCGQYLHAQIAGGLIERLVRFGELKDGPKNKGAAVAADDAVIEEIRAMSSATMDRYLKEERRRLEPISLSATKKPSYPLRGEIPFGKSYMQVDGPGWLSTDTVAHCGDTLKGNHLWTLNSTDACTGWTETVTIKSRARVWIKEGHDEILSAFPFKVKGVNYDDGSEFINYEMIDYSKLHNYQMTRSRPYHSNDNAHVEQKNYDIVRKHAFRYRYEGQEVQDLLNRLWYWVNLRKNYLVPTKKCIGHTKTASGRTRGIYDKPKTPYQRVLKSKVLDKDKGKDAELRRTFERLNDAHITRMILSLQHELLKHVKDKDMVEFIEEAVRSADAA